MPGIKELVPGAGEDAIIFPVRDKGGERFNVRAFGAKGDIAVAASDHAAIQLATNEALAVSGEVYFPPAPGGFYPIDAPWVVQGDSISVVASGRGVRVDQQDPAADGLQLFGSSHHFHNIHIRGPGKGVGTGRGFVYDPDWSNPGGSGGLSTLINLSVNYFGSHGFYLQRPELFRLFGLTSQYCGGSGIYLTDNGMAKGMDNLLIGCRTRDNGIHQIHVEGQLGGNVLLNCQGLRFADIAAAGQYLLFIQGAMNNTIIGGDYEGKAPILAFCSGRGGSFQGVHFIGKGSEGYTADVGIKTGVNLDGIIEITRCRFNPDITNSIHIDGSTAARVSALIDGSISGPIFHPSARTILDNGSKITTRRIAEVDRIETFPDGAATPDVSGNKVFRTSNTAATIITNFTGGDSGQPITVIIKDSNTTIQHSTSIRFKDGLDKSAIHTAWKFINDGVGWIEV